MLWLDESGLYNQETFYRTFINDVNHAKRRVIIESPFITFNRIEQLMPILQKLVRRGVMVVVNTKPFEEHDGLMQDMSRESVEKLQDMGARVIMTVGHHRKLAIVDDAILWEGSLNILSQNDSCEFMRRIHSEQATGQMLRFLRLDRYYRVE